MIGWLKGLIIDKPESGKLVLETHGVGYDVETSLHTFCKLETRADHPVGLHIHTVVREDALLLYGFLDKQERALFRSLIKINGIGPKVALSILSHTTPDEFMVYLHKGEVTPLTKIPGIGKKTAERLLLEMQDGAVASWARQLPAASPIQTEALSALETLGYKPNEAIKLLQRVTTLHASCEDLIRAALKHVDV